MSEVKCPSCGSPNVEQIDTDKYQCPYCGKEFNHHAAPQPQMSGPSYTPFPEDNVDDKPGCFMNGLCFLFPIVGVIMYFVKKDTMPKCAKSYIQWALAGFILEVICQILF